VLDEACVELLLMRLQVGQLASHGQRLCDGQVDDLRRLPDPCDPCLVDDAEPGAMIYHSCPAARCAAISAR
jgi:hypothetical protein